MSLTITTAADQDAAAALAVARRAYRREHPIPAVTLDVECPRCLAVSGTCCRGPGREKRSGGGAGMTSHPERRAALDEARAVWRAGLVALNTDDHPLAGGTT